MTNGIGLNLHTPNYLNQNSLFADQTVGFTNVHAAKRAFGAQFAKENAAVKKRQSSVSQGAGASSGSASGKKELKYNHKAFTRKIMQAKTPAMATMIAAQIRVKINDLNNKLKSGEYDPAEVMSAIAHATAMEAAAKSRADHLKLEEEAERKARQEENFAALSEAPSDDSATEEVMEEMEEAVKKEMDEAMQELLQEMQEEMAQMMEDIAQTEEFYDALDELNKVMSGEMTPEDIEAMKKRHRAEENGVIGRADMEYLKFKFQQLQAQKNAAAAGTFSAASSTSSAFSSAHIATSSPVTYSPAASSIPHISVSPQQPVINVEA